MNAYQIWKCPACHRLHDTYGSAQSCCEPGWMWRCETCRKTYEDESEADKCCVKGGTIAVLKPCPFCGEKEDGERGIGVYENHYNEFCRVQCEFCGGQIIGDDHTEESARAKWNRRAA